MQKPRNLVPQEVPPTLAATLRQMRDEHDPRLNAVLAKARTMGWRTATLAGVLGMEPSACSKRIERSHPLSREAFIRQAIRDAAQVMETGKSLRKADKLRALVFAHDAERSLDRAMVTLGTTHTPATEQARGLLVRATQYVPQPAPDISDVEIPLPAKIPTTMSGKRLAADEIEQLRQMHRTASRVNGSVPSDDPARKVSVEFTKKLVELIDERKFTPYYLAKVLGITHRAVTSRLERHGYRQPCPSVRDTPSGVYRGRKIGEQVDNDLPVAS